MDIDQLEDSALFRANSVPEMVDLLSDDDVHSPRGGQDGALDPMWMHPPLMRALQTLS